MSQERLKSSSHNNGDLKYREFTRANSRESPSVTWLPAQGHMCERLGEKSSTPKAEGRGWSKLKKFSMQQGQRLSSLLLREKQRVSQIPATVEFCCHFLSHWGFVYMRFTLKKSLYPFWYKVIQLAYCLTESNGYNDSSWWSLFSLAVFGQMKHRLSVLWMIQERIEPWLH